MGLLRSLSRSLSKRGRSSGDPDNELMAVIAAAVAASSGLAPGSFRILSVEAGRAICGLNTPIWGYVERLNRTPFRA